MALLMLFGFVAGAGTAVSPCVLPVLPIALSAGAAGGRRRPLGIVLGLAVSFTFATVALAYLIAALGLPNDLLRKLAIAFLLAFGASLMIPSLAARIEARLSRLAGRAGVARTRGDGLWSGAAVGASLGLVYAPCAGPILAGVITVSASQSFTTGRLAVALSYGLGSALVLYLLMLGGRRLLSPLSRRGIGLQVAMGAVMVLVGVAMAANYDIRFQNAIASSLPSFLVTPTEGLEKTPSVRSGLNEIRGEAAHGIGAVAAAAPPAGRRSGLPVLGKAPKFADTQRWFNTPGDRPLRMRSLRGHVVLVDFWTYSCINCLRTLPYLNGWYRAYHRDGFETVGVHSPEFPFEKSAANVQEAIERNGIHYPVAQDNDLATWSAYGNQYWPAEYFVDTRGRVRYADFGEGEYTKKEHVIRALLAEAGHPVAARRAAVHGIAPSVGVTTPETYLGAARAERFANPKLTAGLHDYGALPHPAANGFAYGGRWAIRPESATAEGGSLALNFGARRVYVVLGSPGRARRVRVLLDGRPLPRSLAGADVHNGILTVSAQRLYSLVELPRVEHHVVRLEPEAGVMAYSFTFG